jgi:predicted CXXCH cytochrome family protein
LSRKSALLLGLAAAFLLVAFAIGLGPRLIAGLSVARREPSTVETAVATWFLHESVPTPAKARLNPLGSDPADLAAGRDLYRQKCATCHGYDGKGATEIGASMYPRAPSLGAPAVQSMSDGEVFYHIRNGIRNTAMPAWNLPDRQIWQLVLYLRKLPITAALGGSDAAPPRVPSDARYVGSLACRECHAAIYDRWRQTRMANVVRDPREHPDAIIPDLSKPDPLLTFSSEDIALVYGSRWKQRYFKKIGDDYVVLPAQWDITHRIWRRYFVANNADWWARLYPPDNLQRPTGPLCDGCHSVNYDVTTKSVTEWNVGCERCHGAGSTHVAHPLRANIINPARLDYVHANDTCIQCHSQGRPPTNPIGGHYYDWPVGFHMGLDLARFWQLEEHKLGETTFTHFADGTAHKNRMQGNDFVQSLMYARGVTCFSCHDPHGSENEGMLRRPASAVCSECHWPGGPNGPHAASIEAHTHHAAGSMGSACIGCHMPPIAQTIADVNVRSHTFRFVTPAETDALGVPNACNACHADRSTAWATTQLQSWTDRSPWRMGR